MDYGVGLRKAALGGLVFEGGQCGRRDADRDRHARRWAALGVLVAGVGVFGFFGFAVISNYS